MQRRGQAAIEYLMNRASRRGVEIPSGNRRGQAAIEYLMNYAWAIAIVVIVGVAIFSLNIGDIGFSLSSSGSSLSQQFEQLAVIGHKWGVTGGDNVNDTFTVVVQNNGANKITLNSINVTEIDKSTLTQLVTNVTPATLFPGETATRVLPINTTLHGITKSIGGIYSVKLTFNYTDTETNVIYAPSTTLKARAQTD